MGVTVGPVLPRLRKSRRPPATAKMTAAEIATGSQLRSEGSGGRTSWGPVLTSGIVHCQIPRGDSAPGFSPEVLLEAPAQDWSQRMRRCVGSAWQAARTRARLVIQKLRESARKHASRQESGASKNCERRSILEADDRFTSTVLLLRHKQA